MWQKIIKFSIYSLVFLVPLFWLPISFEAFEFNKGYLLFILVSIGLIAWLGKMIFQDKEIRFRRSPLDFYVLGFLVVMIFSALLSQDKISSLLGFYGRFWPSLIGTLSLGGLYFLVTNNIGINQSKSASISGILKAFLWSSFFVVLTAYFSLFGIWTRIETLFPGNFQFSRVMKLRIFNSIGGSLEQLSVFLAFISVLVIGLLAFKEKPASAPAGATASKGKKRGNLGFFILLFASLFLLALTDFWPAWLVIFLALLFFLGFAFWKRIFKEDVSRLNLSIFFLLICLVFLLSNPLQNLLPQDSNLSNLPREVLLSQNTSWNINWQGLKEHPVLGAGLGNFSYVFSKFRPQSLLQTNLWQIRFDRAGSHIAEILGSGGILGILSYGFMLGMFLLISWMILKLNPKSKIQISLLFGFLALLIAQFVFYQNTVLAFSFWLFLGLGVVSWQKPLKEKTYSFKEFPEIGLVFSTLFWVILIGFLALYFFGAKFYLADTHYRKYLMNPSQNLEELEKAVRLADSRTVYHIALARAYLQKFNEETAKLQPSQQIMTNLVALAVQQGNRAVQISPNRAAARETQGVVYREIQVMAQGALEWGIKSFEKAIALEPQNPVLLAELGKLKVIEGKSEEGKELFERALAIREDYFGAVLQMAFLEEREGKTDQAIERLVNLTKRNPFLVEVQFQLGRLYYNENKLDEAILRFQSALTIFPNHSNSLYSLGLALERKGEKTNALEVFEKVLELNPGNEDVIRKIEELKK